MGLVGIVGKILSCYLITLLTCYAIAFPCNVKVLVVFPPAHTIASAQGQIHTSSIILLQMQPSMLFSSIDKFWWIDCFDSFMLLPYSYA
jgi:hypothetical protein